MKVLEKVEKFSNGKLFKYQELTNNHRRWLKFQGNEGQDVYVSMFKDDCENLLGEFPSIVVENPGPSIKVFLQVS